MSHLPCPFASVGEGKIHYVVDLVERNENRMLFQDVQADLSRRWVGRDDAIDAMLLSVLGQQHLLLTGPRGTAKSALATDVFSRFPWLSTFHTKLSERTDPDSVLGRTEIPKIKEGNFTRNVAGRLPGVHLAFLDEFTRGSQDLLDALLPILQERLFDNDGVLQQVPLQTCIAAANHDLQQISELPDWYAALQDRFLYRNHVEYVAGTRLHDLLSLAVSPIGNGKVMVDQETFQQAAKTVPHVTVPTVVNDVFRQVYGKVSDMGIQVSDRRWMQCVQVLRTSAVYWERSTVELEDVWALRHALTGNGKPDADTEITALLRTIADPNGPILAEILNLLAKVTTALSSKQYGETLDERTTWATKRQAELREAERTVEKTAVPQRRKDEIKVQILNLRRQVMDDVLGLELGGLKF